MTWLAGRPTPDGDVTMKIKVSQCAYHHTTDIDPERRVDSRVWDRLVNKCVARAATALEHEADGYNELQRHHISDIFNSMSATHRTIRRILDAASDEPGSVDVLALGRLQLEGLYAVCLMLEGSRYVDAYLQDHWRKRYVEYLLVREETLNLPRWADMAATLTPVPLIKLRLLFGISDAQQLTVEHEELGRPLPPGITRQPIPQFPTPGKTIDKIPPGDKRRMLERLYLKYVELCSFAHGLPQSNLLKIMFDKRSPHTRFFTDEHVRERFQRDVVGEAFIISFFSIVQSVTELTHLYRSDLELPSAAIEAWNQLSEASLLTKAIWNIRSKTLLGVI